MNSGNRGQMHSNTSDLKGKQSFSWSIRNSPLVELLRQTPQSDRCHVRVSIERFSMPTCSLRFRCALGATLKVESLDWLLRVCVLHLTIQWTIAEVYCLFLPNRKGNTSIIIIIIDLTRTLTSILAGSLLVVECLLNTCCWAVQVGHGFPAHLPHHLAQGHKLAVSIGSSKNFDSPKEELRSNHAPTRLIGPHDITSSFGTFVVHQLLHFHDSLLSWKW